MLKEYYISITTNLFLNVKKILSKKEKGEINYWLAIGVGCAALLIIGWPLIKTTVSETFTAIKTWLSNNLSKIFSAVS
ncbi:MAG: hypothetical protein N2448_06475 [Caloramator sp.]|nr:hypothetical protein [Caloramator sp.]